MSRSSQPCHELGNRFSCLCFRFFCSIGFCKLSALLHPLHTCLIQICTAWQQQNPFSSQCCTSALSFMAASARSGPSRPSCVSADLFIRQVFHRHNLKARQPFLLCASIPFAGAQSLRVASFILSVLPVATTAWFSPVFLCFPRIQTFLSFCFALAFRAGLLFPPVHPSPVLG